MSWTSFTHDIKYWGADEWKIIKLPINPFNLSSVAKFGPTAVIYNKYNIAAPQKMYNLSEFSCKNVNWWKFIGRVGAAVVEATFITITSPSLASKQERVCPFFFKDIFLLIYHHASPWSMVVFLFCLAVGRVGWILTKSTGDLTMCRIPTKPTTPNIGLNRKRLSISNDVEEKNIAGSFAPQSCPIHVALQFLCEESCSCTAGYKPEVTNISNSRLRECEMQSCGRQCCTALKLLCKHSISKVQAQY